MVVEHQWLLEQGLREEQRAGGVAGQKYALGERRDRMGDGWGPGVTLPRDDSMGGDACMSAFKSPQEFREVMDRTFALMSEDSDMGLRLREADTPQRFEFTDYEMVVNIRAGADGEPNLIWEWTDEVSWEPTVRMTMSSETANRYFQGKENVAIAIARRRIKAGRRQGGSRDHPDHKAAICDVSGDDRRPLPAPRGLIAVISTRRD